MLLLVFVTCVFCLIYALIGACDGAEDGLAAIVDALNSDPINAGLSDDDVTIEVICDKADDMSTSANLLMAGAVLTHVAQIMILVFFSVFAAKVEQKIDSATHNSVKEDYEAPSDSAEAEADDAI